MKSLSKKIDALSSELNSHPILVTDAVKDLEDLHIFMEHHVYAVWDFMSLIKSLQNILCPSTFCWVPSRRSRRLSNSARLINEIILAEESDIDIDGKNAINHFHLYMDAMREVRADLRPVRRWLTKMSIGEVPYRFENDFVPPGAQAFMKKTFEFITTGKPHVIAGAFAYGRETVIPMMFKNLLQQLDLTELECPRFHYYLERHIEVDGDEHGPASLMLVENICNGDRVAIHEARSAAEEAIEARIQFWDSVAELIAQNKRQKQ